MSNSIKFNLNHIRLGLIELFETAIDIYKFYSAQMEQGPSLSPQAQSAKARQGPTAVRPEFTVDYDEERNHKDAASLLEHAAEVEAAQEAKVGLTSGFGVSIARAAAETLDKQIMQSFDTEDREALAELCHRQWSGWMRYLFKKCEENEDGTVTIPRWAVKRWSRQMETEYSQLSEDERLSDRIEADKFLALIEQRVTLQ